MDGVKRRSRTEQNRNNQDEEQEEDCFIYSNLQGTQGWLDQKLFFLIVWKRAKNYVMATTNHASFWVWVMRQTDRQTDRQTCTDRHIL